MNTEANLAAKFLQSGAAIIRYGYLSDFSIDRLFNILDVSEKRTADNFYLTERRLQYIGCRSILKLLLAQYLGIDAEDIQLRISPGGKPMLPGMSAIQFNVSHSHNIMLWGISHGNIIGVDVEHLDRQIPLGALMQVCSEAELTRMKSVRGNIRHESFINCWTRKEALLKAVGSLSLPLKQFEVSMSKTEKVEVLATPWSDIEKDQWLLHSLDMPGDYRGAVAIKGKVSHVDTNCVNNTLSDWLKPAALHTHSESSILFYP